MPARRPHVIVFFTDQQRHDTTGVHGCPLGLTPNFDRLATRGTHVANSFTCQPVCGPARACLQTGLYPTTTGIWRNGIALPPARRTLAHHFGAAGYHTAYIGKWHLADPAVYGAVPRSSQGGYDYWLAANVLEFTSDAYETNVWDREGRKHRLPGYRVDALTDAAIRLIDGRRRSLRPTFLFLSFIEPHQQNHRGDFAAPDGCDRSYVGSWMPPDLHAPGGTAHRHWPGYCGMVRRLDEALGRLIDALRSLDRLDDTIILYTSDHGCHFQTRNSEYKRSCHDASIRVPTALSGGPFDAGGELRELVSLIDLPPTLLDAAGIPVPPEMQGKSLLPLVRRRPVVWPDTHFVQISESQTGRAVRTHRWKYGVRCPDTDTAGHPVSRRDASSYADDCLYDLLGDPWEQANLIGVDSFRSVTNDLRRRLTARMIAAGERAPQFIDAPARPSWQRDPDRPAGPRNKRS